MIHGFNVVPVRVEHVGTEVAMVILPIAGSTIVPSASPGGRRMELPHRLLRAGTEGDMDWPARWPVVAQEQLTDLHAVIPYRGDPETKRLGDGVVEGTASSEVSDSQMDVVYEKPVLVGHAGIMQPAAAVGECGDEVMTSPPPSP